MTGFSEWAESADDESAKKSTGKYLSRLNATDAAEVTAFGEWLIANGSTEAGAASYRSYLAQAFCAYYDGVDLKTLSSSVRSAVRRYRGWKK